MAAEFTLQTLEDHRRLTKQVASGLQVVHDAAASLGLEEVQTRAAELLERAEDQVFRVAVVGEFKRGKSTLINALLGREVLPADVLPCSATLNRVTYGLQPSVRLRFKPDKSGNAREETIGIDDLADYVTKLTPDSEQRAADIAEAVVHYPSRYCRDKADIIDTPGLNDDAAMTDVTMAVLPTVDAAVLVILAQSPFSGYEGEFLNRLLTHDLGRVLFVVNRMDEIRKPKDRERVLKVVSDRIIKAVTQRAGELYGQDTPEALQMIAHLGTPRVYGVSGADALDGKLEDDSALLEGSGFPEFEHALERFLTLERGLVALTVLASASASASAKVHQQVLIRRGAIGLESSRFEQVFKENEARLQDLRRDYELELRSMDRASTELAETLRPLAKRLSDKIIEGAEDLIANYPLDAASIDKARLEKTEASLNKALTNKLQSIGRREAERLNLEIEKGVFAELERLQGVSQQMTQSLRAIEFDFRAPGADDGDDDLNLLAGGIAGVFSAFAGGAVGGGLSGYRIAGVEGAALGAGTGLALGFGTAVGLLAGAITIGLPLTWPVTLPALAVSGVIGSLGGKAIVNRVFSGRRVEKYRKAYRDAVIGKLESEARHRTKALSTGMDSQVREAFAAVRTTVEAELGGAIASTERTMTQLKEQRLRSDAQRAVDLEELDRLDGQLQKIEHQATSLLTELRPLPEA
jgi:hypothetical protein